MRDVLAIMTIVLAGATSAATVGGPALSPFADTESSTNVVFSVGNGDTRKFNLSIELNAASSNNLVVAFGRDTNTNGVLDRAEMDLLVGWDSGEWFYRDRISGNEQRVARASGERRLDWQIRLSPSQEAIAVSAYDANGSVFDNAVPPTMFNSEWNLMRVVARGRLEPSALVVANAVGWGFRVILR